MSSGRVLLAVYLLLAAGFNESDGAYSPLALVMIASSFGLFIWTLALTALDRNEDLPPVEALAAALALVLLMSLRKQPASYLQWAAFASWAHALTLTLAVCLLMYHPKGPRVARRSVFAFGVVLGAALRVGVVVASPTPMIDVFELAQQGAGYLLHGRNPYVMPVWGTPLDGQIYSFEGYAYPPGNLLLQTLAFAVAKDVRYASIVAEAVFGLALWAVSRGLSRAPRELIVLLFLFHPRSLFTIEQAWTEPLIIGGLGLSVWAWQARRCKTAAAILGMTLGLKQYLALIGLHFLLLERKLRHWAILAAAGLAAFVPFLILDAGELWRNGLWLVLNLPFSNQALTLASALNRWNGWTPGPALSVLVGLLAGAGIPFILRRADPLPRFLLSITGTLFASFFLGAKAFGNYYYLIGALLLIVLAIRGERTPELPAKRGA